jgi:ATP-binding cassette subfamily F protein uup
VLDEPTNDLDLVTLTVLERLLVEFQGAVLLVTHDRWFLDKVATAILAVEGDGRVTRYEGNWEMYRRLRVEPPKAATAEAPKPAPAAAPAPKKPGKLTYKDQRELDGMEAAIEAAEVKKAGLEAELAAAATDASELVRLSSELEKATAEVDRLYARWQELQSVTGA